MSPAMSTPPKEVAPEDLRSFIRRVLNVMDEIDALTEDKKSIYKDAADSGFDRTVMSQVVGHLRKKAKNLGKFETQSEMFDLYLAAYEGIGTENANASAHAAREPEHDADGVIIEPGNPGTDLADTVAELRAVSAEYDVNFDGYDAQTREFHEPQSPSAAGQVEHIPLETANEDATACAPVASPSTAGEDGNGLRLKGNATTRPERSVGSRESGSLAVDRGITQREDDASPAPSQASPAPTADNDYSSDVTAEAVAKMRAKAAPALAGAVLEPVAGSPESPAAMITEGLQEALAVAKGEAEPHRVHVVAAPVPGEVRIETCPPEPVRWHEFANCFPPVLGDALAALEADIHKTFGGVQKPIVKIGNLILDGRARYGISRAMRIPYPVVEYDGTDALADVIRWNMEARDLSASERKAIASKLMKLPSVAHRASEIAAMFELEVEAA